MRREWRLAHGRSLILGEKAILMGILNVTPDSFSDGGLHDDLPRALAAAHAMREQGAAIIDVGGESTRPDAVPVDAATEQARILPVIGALAKSTDCIISVDTYREQTARLAVAAGAHIVNDVWGLQREPGIANGEPGIANGEPGIANGEPGIANGEPGIANEPGIADLAAETGAGLVIMHTGRERERDPDVIADQFAFLDRSLGIARAARVEESRIVLDPGFGFAKDSHENVMLMARFAELQRFGFPLLVGTSRKRLIGAMTGRDAADRDAGTAATSAILRLAGADIFRVHNVAMNRDALAVADAILESGAAE
ncbi:dihydropteroate synthase [Phyllobacterium salinisoli]|uniref:dihydropteroate synthase n=1 Tax=Phyllobacterium salinisoli TaxID=1899321 RepID=A0A368K7E1_9HYPH|nr:dihydropteroate synthase [Phyllobacterium salinisoli]RCS25269.1 dihydropteroate synthase [Phyllobacterium salinisoli]